MVQDRCMGRTITLDGIEVSVMPNVRSRDDVELAMNCGADGIGLFRTEPFFLSTKHFPSDREFAEFLVGSLQLAQGRHIDVRFLDIGADKNPIYLHCQWNLILSWADVACACCLSIPTCWKRSCGPCCMYLSNSALGL